FPKIGKIIINPFAFILYVETCLQPAILSGNPCGAGIIMTYLSLDAAYAQHGFPCDIDYIYPQCKCHCSFSGKSYFSCPHKDNTLAKATVLKYLIYIGKTINKRQ